MPTVPWASVVAMRHRLVHAYCDMDGTILWKTATEEMPPLHRCSAMLPLKESLT